ncbi:MAG: hypothetical protein ABR584_08955 [Candidatus Baltobacteraceae bacterium]
MEASTALFNALIDYAGLFPPAELQMQPAAEEYDTVRTGEWAWMCGRFIVPASRVFELCEELEDLTDRSDLQPYPLSVIIDSGTDPLAWLGKATGLLGTLVKCNAEGMPVRIEALEVPVPPVCAARDTYDPVIGQFGMAAQNAGLRKLPIYVEIPRTDRYTDLLPGAMAAVARAKFGAKIRCGGATQAAVPSSAEVGAFLRAAFAENVAFKATAGLHHPVRHRDAQTGFFMHGFLNMLAATIFIRDGATDDELLDILEEQDKNAFTVTADAFSWRHRTASVQQIQGARSAGFVSYGSCSFEEPVQDLMALGILRLSKAGV